MIHLMWIRVKRKPLVFLAILLFTAMIALALCRLHQGNTEAQAQYDEIYDRIHVRCTVTNLAGNQSDRLDIVPGYIRLFTESGDLSRLLEDVQIKGSAEILWNGESYTLAGITATEIEPRLWPENGCTFFWRENADIDFWGGDEMACIIPQALEKQLADAGQSADTFSLQVKTAFSGETDCKADLRILGTYQGTNDKIIYCPWRTYVAVMNASGHNEMADAIHATLRSNDLLPVLQQTASQYFARPDPDNAGLELVGNHYLALDINDSQLSQAKVNLDNSMTLNRMTAVLVLAFTAAAGSFIGFLVVHKQKKEIALLRTVGTSNGQIYTGLVVPQMCFVILGTIVGGAKHMWDPVSWLAVFVCVYFVSLSVALLVMLRKNLLTTIKEDE